MHIKNLKNHKWQEIDFKDKEIDFKDKEINRQDIFEDAESDEDIFMDAEEGPISQHAHVWDNTRDQTITYGDISLRFLNSGKKHHQGKKDIEITSGSYIWNEGYGWSIAVIKGEIYSTGFNDKEPRCYVLRSVKRISGSQKGNWVWDQPSLPSYHPVAKKMIAEVKKEMKFN